MSIGRTAGDYSSKTLEEHIYALPETYLGNDQAETRPERLLDLTTMKMVDGEITFPEVITRLFLELLSNAGDNTELTRRTLEEEKVKRADFDPAALGLKVGPIEVTMDRRTLTIRNYGLPIPVELKTAELYTPEYIFGQMLTSANYDESKARFGAGKNGYGAKLVNIFSLHFVVKVVDTLRKKYFEIQWFYNKRQKLAPVIRDLTSSENWSMVEISCVLDFPRFKLTEYPDEAFHWLACQALDMGFAYGHLPISFNGLDLTVKTLDDYVQYFVPTPEVNKIIHYEWPEHVKTHYKHGTKYTEEATPLVELCLIDTPHQERQISFVNGMPTPDGGVHVDAAYDAAYRSIIDHLNKSVAKQERKYRLTMRDIKRHVTIILRVTLPNPKFDSQKKRMLKAPAPKIILSKTLLRSVENWRLIEVLNNDLKAKLGKGIRTGKKKRHLTVTKLQDANLAGKPRWRETTLILVEGDSAAQFPAVYISRFENGRDYFGIYPLKGKLLNVRNATELKIVQDEMLINIKEILNLQDGLDYSLEENFNTLRYGRVMIMADADVDGKHICGLINLFFVLRFPSLYSRNYISFMRTPIKEISVGRTNYKFFTEASYQNFLAQHPEFSTAPVKYHKGLGGFKKEQIKEDDELCRDVRITASLDCYNIMMKVFNKDQIEERKKWILTTTPCQLDHAETLPLGLFIDKEMIEYPLANLERSIPSALDGFKDAQRKILWGLCKQWNIYSTGKKTSTKVQTLASFVSVETNYHHGEKSLSKAIINMTQTFVGSNNLPFFTDDGLFGSRNALGKDAADPRYCFAGPAPWLEYVFKKADQDLLNFKVEEGKSIEPEFFLPIIPMQLVNGSEGIGTGWSTFIPCHNPVEICQWYIKRLASSGPIPDMIRPWYRGFCGTIEIRSSKKGDHRLMKKAAEEDPVSVVEEVVEEVPVVEEGESEPKSVVVDYVATGNNYTMVTVGKFEPGPHSSTIITEIPLGISIIRYNEYLDSLRESKKIKDKSNLCDDDRIKFVVKGLKHPSARQLHLYSRHGLNNMILLNQDHRPVHFKNTHEILEWFYNFRLAFYPKRKDLLLRQMHEKLEFLHAKYRLIRLVIDRPADFLYQPVSKVRELLEREKIPAELFKKVKLVHLTKEDLVDIHEQIVRLDAEYRAFEAVDPRVLWHNDLVALMEYCQRHP